MQKKSEEKQEESIENLKKQRVEKSCQKPESAKEVKETKSLEELEHQVLKEKWFEWRFETMVPVVVICALFIFIVFPSWKDYRNRVKVAEALNFLVELKRPAEKYYDSKGRWPAVEELTVNRSGKYIENIISNKSELYFEATMKNDGSPISSCIVRLYYDAENDIWRCNDYYDNRIPNKYLPIVCR